MTKMTRPVTKHLASLNFKNWDRLNKVEKILTEALENNNENYLLHSELIPLLTQVRNDVIFIDETFRVWLEEGGM